MGRLESLLPVVSLAALSGVACSLPIKNPDLAARSVGLEFAVHQIDDIDRGCEEVAESADAEFVILSSPDYGMDAVFVVSGGVHCFVGRDAFIFEDNGSSSKHSPGAKFVSMGIEVISDRKFVFSGENGFSAGFELVDGACMETFDFDEDIEIGDEEDCNELMGYLERIKERKFLVLKGQN